MSRERKLGPFTLVTPEPGAFVRPDHEHQAVGLVIERHRLIQGHVGERLESMLGCSRAEWMAFVAAIKAGRANVNIPTDPRD